MIITLSIVATIAVITFSSKRSIISNDSGNRRVLPATVVIIAIIIT